jgi:hypothetical protein
MFGLRSKLYKKLIVPGFVLPLLDSMHSFSRKSFGTCVNIDKR